MDANKGREAMATVPWQSEGHSYQLFAKSSTLALMPSVPGHSGTAWTPTSAHCTYNHCPWGEGEGEGEDEGIVIPSSLSVCIPGVQRNLLSIPLSCWAPRQTTSGEPACTSVFLYCVERNSPSNKKKASHL